MPKSIRPAIRELSDKESRGLLARKDVGRLAYSFHDRVNTEPINYVVDGDWIYGRTSVGSKLISLAHHPWCAFEVDDVRGRFEWESAVVHGTFHLLDPEHGSVDAYDQCLRLLRLTDADTLRVDDPTPNRGSLFRIHIDEITGRRATKTNSKGEGVRALLSRAARQNSSSAAPDR